MTKGQTKKRSLLETVVQIAIGFITSLAIYEYIVLPLIAASVITQGSSIAIGAIFAVFGLIRTYAIRRASNRFEVLGQPKKQSIVECLTHATGSFVVSVIGWEALIMPLFIYDIITIDNSIAITCIFTVVSLLRMYIVRRIGNRYSISGVKP